MLWRVSVNVTTNLNSNATANECVALGRIRYYVVLYGPNQAGRLRLDLILAGIRAIRF